MRAKKSGSRFKNIGALISVNTPVSAAYLSTDMQAIIGLRLASNPGDDPTRITTLISEEPKLRKQ
jgi:hypothetical protein